MWKDIQGYEGLYEANTNGSVRRKGSDNELTGFVNRDGYVILSFSKNGEVKKFRRNRIIASTFIPNPDNLPYVNHKDEIKTNDAVSNLEWCDAKYNANYGTGIQRSKEQKYKPVARISNNGEVVVYSSITLAAQENEVTVKLISQAVIRKTQCKGYDWALAEFNIKYD